jgi:acid stress-induced BolA-like protein IbaG/YrbA
MATAKIINASVEDSGKTLTVTASVDEGGTFGIQSYFATIVIDAEFRGMSPMQKLATITSAIKSARDAQIADRNTVVSVLIGKEITV